ncbi:thioesterase-like superfamily-domain-containing protein [Whalleya microplaca]|nr:thioesterase-like superfamily-domain-containing protein [Whalleya microplaca]
MARNSALQTLVSVDQRPELGPDIYSNHGPLVHQIGGNAFGGSIISQAVSAAAATVAPGFNLYSSQSSFLRPIKADLKVDYQVDRTADGRRFATRTVRATQGARDGRCLYTAILSFQKSGDSDGVLTYCDPMPAVDGTSPYDVPRQGFRQFGFQAQGSPESSADGTDDGEPFEWRLLPFEPAQQPLQMRARGFVRSALLATESQAIQSACMAFVSDVNLLELALLTNWEAVPENMQSLAMSTTLTHHILLHSPTPKANEWMVCESGTSGGADGRILLQQRFWDFATGRLVMSCLQEALSETPGARL